MEIVYTLVNLTFSIKSWGHGALHGIVNLMDRRIKADEIVTGYAVCYGGICTIIHEHLWISKK